MLVLMFYRLYVFMIWLYVVGACFGPDFGPVSKPCLLCTIKEKDREINLYLILSLSVREEEKEKKRESLEFDSCVSLGIGLLFSLLVASQVILLAAYLFLFLGLELVVVVCYVITSFYINHAYIMIFRYNC
ncbi:hypothetical protein FRX31_001945 [Thalictrum thalictroides]|uniref:Transmembrane protein n=1 Tax=Thalictrum thalictroides TaxID=46969 RepID=A0A7J6XGV5_THATH|nr:hypothetical protein FRX31_001945 [Thalictrum thalictroides]